MWITNAISISTEILQDHFRQYKLMLGVMVTLDLWQHMYSVVLHLALCHHVMLAVDIIVMKMQVYDTFSEVVTKMCWLSKIDSL